MEQAFTIVPKISLTPTKLVYYNEFINNVLENRKRERFAKTGKLEIKQTKKTEQCKNLKKERTKLEMSENAQRNLRKKITWLYYLAKSKSITSYSGKKFYNFKIGFITLTLPSKQKHSTNFITKNLLNQFLTEVRQRTKMENYIWRLEFQKNGNVHYHLVSDTYLDYFFIRQIWNRILDNYGYISPYTEKMKNLSLSQYVSLYKNSDKNNFEILAKRYAKGCKEKWKQPNSVDCKNVIGAKKISFYISKYFSKNSDDNPVKNELDSIENMKGLRLWFCSRSLSKVDAVREFLESFKGEIADILHSSRKIKIKVYRYVKIIYFNIRELENFIRKEIEICLRGYSKSLGYSPAT